MGIVATSDSCCSPHRVPFGTFQRQMASPGASPKAPRSGRHLRLAARGERSEPAGPGPGGGHESPDADLPLRLEGGPSRGHRGSQRGRPESFCGRHVDRGWDLTRRDPAPHLGPAGRSGHVAVRAPLLRALTARPSRAGPGTTELLEGIVSSWIEPAAEIFRSHGLTPADARRQARLNLAVVRGLLLDLLATGDRAGVAEAMEHFLHQSAATRPETASAH